MSWIPDTGHRKGLLGTLSLNPEPANALHAYRKAIWSQPYLPITVLELCRLRLAQLHNCQEQWQTRNIDAHRAGITDDKIEQLPQWHRDPQFSAAEKACLEFAEVYFQDPQALTDAQAEAVKAHFGESGLVVLVQALGLFDAQCRLALLLGIE